MTNQSAPWAGASKFLDSLAERKLRPADYAIAVRHVYYGLAERAESDDARDFVLRQVLAQYQLDRVSEEHYKAAAEILPRPLAKRPGRPKDALGKKTYDRRYQLLFDWKLQEILDPSLTKERFAKRRLGITDAQYGDDDLAHARVAAVLQDLKPARMKYLDEEQPSSVDFHVFITTQARMRLARDWHNAKKGNPELTKEDFVRRDLSWAVGEPSADLIRQQLEHLEQGEKLLAASEHR